MTEPTIIYKAGPTARATEISCGGVPIPGVTSIQVHHGIEELSLSLTLELFHLIAEIEVKRENVSAVPSENLLDTLNKIPVPLIRDILAGIEDYCLAREDAEGTKR